MSTKISAEQIKKIVVEQLTSMGCLDIDFPDPKEDLVVVAFNCRQLTSFQTQIDGWEYSGIHLDPSGKHQFKIDFRKRV